MMTNGEVLQIERGFWLEGVQYFTEMLSPEAVMVFPPPVGVLKHGEILTSIEGASRWTDIDIDAPHVVQHAGGMVAIVYRATAHRRETSEPYRAMCSSVYIDEGTGPRLVLHQQTPIAE